MPFSRLRRRFVRLIAFVILLGTIWVGFTLHRIQEVEKAGATPTRKADAAIVLGAAVWGERPSPGLRERLAVAVTLYKEHYVKKLIASGGVGEGKQISEALAMKNYLLEQGIPEDDILLEEQSHTTYENLQNSRHIMQEYGFTNAYVVSHGFHLARAVDMAEALEMDVTPAAAESKVLTIPYHKAREVLAFTYWNVTSVLGLPAK
ncbi:MAG: YdcF family protein [Clostridia bacterium]